VKAIVLILAILGVVPAIIVSGLLVYVSLFVAPRHALEHPEAKHELLTRRIYFVHILQGQKSTLDTVMWLPIVVLSLAIAFLISVILLLYSHG
jgi:hypothetical protein